MYLHALDCFMTISTELSSTNHIKNRSEGTKLIHSHFLVFRFTIKTVLTLNF